MHHFVSPSFSAALLGACVLTLSACSPALNWRNTTAPEAAVRLMMPCKPESATRKVQLPLQTAYVSAELQLLACEADGLRFSFAQLQTPAGADMREVARVWRLGSLASAQVVQVDHTVQTWLLKNASAVLTPERLSAMSAQRQAQFAWFAYQGKLYQAAVYGTPQQRGLAEAANTFFSAIELP